MTHYRSWITLGVFLAACSLILGGATRSHATPALPASGSCEDGAIPFQGRTLPTVTCNNRTWHCTTRQRHTQVHVVIKDAPSKLDAIHLDKGCYGVLRVTVQTDSGDGIKIHTGAGAGNAECGTLDAGGACLQVWGGPTTGCDHRNCAAIICTGKFGDVHQDGIQAMGGNNIRLMYFKVWCPSGNNGGIFFNGGVGGNGVPTNIVCLWCDLMEANAAFHVGPGSIRSGAEFSKLHTARTKSSPPDCRRVDKDAIDPVDIDNTCLTPK